MRTATIGLDSDAIAVVPKTPYERVRHAIDSICMWHRSGTIMPDRSGGPSAPESRTRGRPTGWQYLAPADDEDTGQIPVGPRGCLPRPFWV
jgi:hypothetical protein